MPLAPSTPLVLDSVAFRADKNVFLNKQELAADGAEREKTAESEPQSDV